jgi:hypothetical protein
MAGTYTEVMKMGDDDGGSSDVVLVVSLAG